jgi:3-oxoacyl-[acyl-carrier protein] reductase
LHQKHSFLIADQNNIEDLGKKIHGLVLQYPVDILINNSGGPATGQVQIAELPDFESAFRQHVLSAHSISKYVIPHMKDKGFGRIINILSTSVKQPLDNLGVSNTIRAAMANWAKTLANELAAFNVTVNNILPGATKTKRLEEIIQAESTKQGVSIQTITEKMTGSIPMKRFAKPEEIANAVAFLASPLASYITGINLPVDGGRTKSL